MRQFCYFLVILMSSISTTTAFVDSLMQPRYYFNGTWGFDYATYNATTVATVTGALLFIALNTAFVTLFLNPSAKQKSSSKAQELEYDYESYYDYNEVRRKKRYVS